MSQRSARLSTIVRKYGKNDTRGLHGGKNGQQLATIHLPKPPRAIQGAGKPQQPQLPKRRRGQPPPGCERKRSFTTWADAETYAIERMAWLRRRVFFSLFVYLCRRCGAWHCRRCLISRRELLAPGATEA